MATICETNWFRGFNLKSGERNHGLSYCCTREPKTGYLKF